MILQVASLRYNVIFKKAFSDVEIFKGFIRDMISVSLEIDRVEVDRPFGRLDAHFDLYTEDPKNKIVVVLQHRNCLDDYNELIYYHCAALLEQVDEFYQTDFRVVTFVVSTAENRHKTDVVVVDFDPITSSGEKLNEIPHQLIYLFPKYVNDETPASYRDWLLAIQDSLDEAVTVENYPQPEIQKVFKMIKKDLISPQERARMKDEYGNEQLEQKKYEEGLAAGEAKGKAAGIAEGEQKAREQMARALLQQGTLDLDTIANLTGLSVDELMVLQHT